MYKKEITLRKVLEYLLFAFIILNISIFIVFFDPVIALVTSSSIYIGFKNWWKNRNSRC